MHRRQIDRAGEVDAARFGHRVQHWQRAVALARPRKDRKPRAGERPRRSGEPARQLGKSIVPPLLAGPVRRGPQRQHGRAVGNERARERFGLLARPHLRGGRIIRKPEQARILPHLVHAGHLAAEAIAAAREHEPGEPGAAQIDDGVPGIGQRLTPETQPMAAERRFLQHDHPREPRHGCEERRRGGPAGDGDPRARMLRDQMREQARRQHRIADARRGDEQDPHGRGL